MTSAKECLRYAEECQRAGVSQDISMRQATILIAMSRSWSTLARQMDQLAKIDGEDTSC
jgi:hypothetical protein